MKYKSEVKRSITSHLPSPYVGMKFALEIASTPALRIDFGARFYDKVLPGCEEYLPLSDAYLECYARTLTGTIYHPCGTCKMGPASDPYSVVDHRLK